MKEKVLSTLKSSETDDWLDIRVVRPLAYYCALGFAKFNIHPNTVTILSMIIGAASCVFFAHGSYYYEGMSGLWLNLLAIFLLIWADVYDCTDGQLARMTGKSSRMGRILDGLAGPTWFVPIYIALTWRFYCHHSLEFNFLGIADTPDNALIATGILFVFVLISGFYSMSGQQRIADYYIQAHLFFLKGEKGSELDNSAKQQEIYDQMTAETPWAERYFQKSYIDYTKKQEKKTPEFQRMLQAMRAKYGTLDNIPAEIRQDFHDSSLPVITWNGLLTFNFRSAWLFLFCLLDIPVMNFVFEIVCMGLLAWYVNHRHESFCKRIREKIENQ